MRFYAPILDDEPEASSILRDLIIETAGNLADVSVEIFNNPMELMNKLSDDQSEVKMCFVDNFIHGMDDLSAIGRPDILTQGGTRAGFEIVRELLASSPSNPNILDTKFAIISSYRSDTEASTKEFHVSADGLAEIDLKVFPKPNSVQGRGASDIKNFILAELSQFNIAKRGPQKGRLDENLLPLLLTVSSLADQIEGFKREVQSNNYLAVHEPEKHKGLLSTLEKISADLIALLEFLPTSPEDVTAETSAQVSSWFVEFRSELESVVEGYASPSNAAKSVVPLGIILGCGTVGALLGGPIGFGAGSVFGQYVTGHIKPGVMSDKLSGIFSRDAENGDAQS